MSAPDFRAEYDRAALPVFSPPKPTLVRGRGSRAWDADGRDYVDFGGGVAVLSLGHSHPKVAEAVCAQARTLSHTSNLHVNDAAAALVARLARAAFPARVFLCNSGAEANEAALKIARRRGEKQRAGRHVVLAFENGFHGRYGFSLAATGKPSMRSGFGPLSPGFRFAPFNDLEAARRQMDDDVCAILAEPIQGEGGIHPAADSFLRGLRELADSHDALLILDEIQSGAGRTGALWAFSAAGIVPDVLTSAKGLGNGFPIGATLAGPRAAQALSPGEHGTTFGGNPVACRAALAVLDELEAPGFLQETRRRSARFLARLEKLNAKFGCFSEIRGRGMWRGCELSGGGGNAAEISLAALEAGVIVITAGGNVLRFAPALNLPEEDAEEGFARLEKALAGMSPRAGG